MFVDNPECARAETREGGSHNVGASKKENTDICKQSEAEDCRASDLPPRLLAKSVSRRLNQHLVKPA